jgi:hypothetical protein
MAVVMRPIGRDGDTEVMTRSSAVRLLIKEHRDAVYLVLSGQSPEDRLTRFRGRRVGRTRNPATGRWSGPAVELETDVERLSVLFDLGRIGGGPYPERVIGGGT